MQDYLEGILDENEPTETYHGVVFSRRLSIRTLRGKVLHIDDPDSLAASVKPGTMLRIIAVVSGVDSVRAFTQSRTDTGKWSGTVRQLDWSPDFEKYQLYDKGLIESTPMSVIGTVNGHVLLSRLLLGGAETGAAVTWGKDQFQLVAVYEK